MNLAYKDIQYSLARRPRKTASIYIERDGQISVQVPQQFTDGEVEHLIEKKRYWIYKNLAEWKDLNATKVVREFVNGEGFPYLGRSYRLKIVDEQDEPLVLKQGYFCLRSMSDASPKTEFREAFKNFYRERGRDRIVKRVEYFQPKMGVTVGEIRIMELQNRWASCTSDGNLNFHWKCMMAPTTVIDYIIVHELAHLTYLNHTDAFWNEVDKVMPDYRERQDWLRQNGAGMDL